MSTDFAIDTKQLLELGATISIELNDIAPEQIGYFETYLKLTDYPYKRSIELSDCKEIVMLSCSGQFRVYLIDYLNSNQITYEEY